jgi:hypothetical protein
MSREEKKLSIHSLWPNLSTPLVRFVTGVGCCQVLCLPLSVFTEVNTVICISSTVAYFEHFHAETFAFFRDTTWKLLFPWISQWLLTLPNVRKGCKILKSSSLEFKIILALSIVYHPSCQLHFRYCPWNVENIVCDNTLHVPSFVHRMGN